MNMYSVHEEALQLSLSKHKIKFNFTESTSGNYPLPRLNAQVANKERCVDR